MTGLRYIKVALFFILLGTAGGVYIVLSSDGLNSFNTRLYGVTLKDASGLSTRSKVYLAGVTVGKIHQIRLEGNEAHLQVAFLRDVEIREGARIARKASSILGTSILTLDPGPEFTPLIPEGGSIDSDQSAKDMNAVIDTVQDLGGKISLLAAELQSNQLQLVSATLESFRSIAEKLNVRSDEELARVSRILESTALITERAQRLLENREDDLEGAAADIRAALENIKAITADIRQGRGNIGQLLYDDRFYSNMVSISEKTDAALDKLEDALDSVHSVAGNVNGVVSSAGEILDRANGMGVMLDTQARYNMLAGTMQAGASLRLEPASNDRWYRIGVSTAPNGIVSRSVKEIASSGGGVREEITETRYTAAIDAELARRFGPLTIRGGLLESTAGIGIDIQPLRWVGFSGEAFDFKKGEAPNLRTSLTVYPFFDPQSNKPWNWLYIRGGVSDVLRDERDVFIGMGLRFADREVRGLAGLIPLAK
ncbi:MAG: MlaD family protein [Treponema sp.]|jgi:phospholipid/cholesterol/gamma-HCH transport system substrate-binding protein|nr:MlaD family protein [Treponema sp.]